MRAASLPEAGAATVSEVLLGDILQPSAREEYGGERLPAALAGGSGEVLYDFRPGVRDLLASGLDTEQSLETVEAVGRALEPYLGRIPDFAALLADPGGSARLSPGATAFAVLVSPVLDRLYGGSPVAGGAALAASGPVTTPPRPPADAVSFSVLGPVRVRRGEDALPSGSPQQRALLAALLLRDGHTATAAELVSALWEADPPAQALAAVRTYAARLRRVLGDGMLLSERGGYVLRLEPGALDLDLARDLAAESERVHRSGDLSLARDLLVRSLDLWDGEALAGLPGPFAAAERVRLEEWRLALLERRLTLDLELGGHAEAVPGLTALTAAHPLRERLRELLMLALYRSGRQAEALAVYADTRRLLADELGVEPVRELSRLQQRILLADDSLFAVPHAPARPRPPEPVRPALLPATVPDFTGRGALVRELVDRLAGTADEAGGSVTALCSVAGLGGIGKTALAVHVAHLVRAHFPDGQLYADLQGAGPRPAEPGTILASFLRALGTPDAGIAESVAERGAQFRAALDGCRMLLLLDNARDAAQVRPLLPGTAACPVLVTSRARMTGLAGAHVVDLDVMSPEEGLQLFTRIVGEERVAAERTAALDVVAACGFLPLAIRIAASRLAARRTWTVSVLAAKLADERRRLHELRAGDLAVTATFELGYGQLEPDQRRAFRLLALADGPDLSLGAAAAVLDLPAQRTEHLLESLVDTSLLDSWAPGRYRYPDLVRIHARACAERDEAPGERGPALSRLLDFYLATAARVHAIERPGDRLVDHLAPTATPGLRFSASGDALDWLYAEAGCLLACARQSSDAPRLSRAVDLLWVTRDLSESGSHAAPYESTAILLLDAAESSGDPRTVGRAALVLAESELFLSRFDAAERMAAQALREAETSGDTAVLCRAAALRGLVDFSRGRYGAAEARLDRALEGFRADGDRPGEASVLGHLARVRLALGNTHGALTLARQAVGIHDGLGRSVRGADARYTLGLALTRAGRYAEAREALHAARDVFGEHRQRVWEGLTCLRLAEAELAAERPAQAAELAEQALGHIGVTEGEQRRGTVLTVLGRALDALGQPDRARTCWQEALRIFEDRDAAGYEEVRGLLGHTAATARRTRPRQGGHRP
ncbi:tetratricopeptide repeat protein [Streptomyces sp. SID161]|nr:tetratricopeptide repeat protein [Streptomyces sp. SID161]